MGFQKVHSLLGLLVAFSGCTSDATLRAEASAISGRIDEAKRSGAYRCAPSELARAEAHLEFLKVELAQGNSVRAAEHSAASKRAMQTALSNSEPCILRDRDGDTVRDEEDRCPDTPGLVELAGCPREIDTDDDGILDRIDACPKVPGPVENRGCPILDQDKDTILDDVDQCPTEPEDFDGFQDVDGCPDPDNDQDGIPDIRDACPLEPETQNEFEDEDGCPDVNLALVEVKRDLGKIEIKQKVFFAVGKAIIRRRSYELLNQVAEALRAYPTMTVLVEGHTDSTGSDSFNLRLSQKRADAVRLFLMEAGIEGERLTALGFGEEKPISSNSTSSGRDQNRRVEFTITGD